MAASYTAAQPKIDELAIYAGFFSAEEGRPYREMMAEHLSRRVEGLKHVGDEDGAARLHAVAERLRQMNGESKDD
jgi:hypothetical protein